MNNEIRITMLVNDRAGDGLLAEHGLSLWIELVTPRGLRHILFDTGAGGALTANARTLGIDLATTDILVLSHGHYDHTGGIAQLRAHAQDARVYCHPGVMLARYSVENGSARPVCIPDASAAAMKSLAPLQLHWVEEPLILFEEEADGMEVGLTGPVPRETAYEDTGGPFFLDPAGTNADPIDDDLALWIRRDNEVIVCVGCSHAGIVNTLTYVRRIVGQQTLVGVIGGFHLLNASKERLQRTVDALSELSPARLLPCHCTGDAAVSALRDAMGDRVSYGSSGTVFRF